MNDRTLTAPGPVPDPSRAGSTASPRAAVVAARDLAASYRHTPVWSGATFEVAAGEFVAVLGPNGAGKSTLLRLLLGLHRPAAGSLSVLGAPPRKGNPSIGYVPQRRPIDPDTRLAGTEFVKLGLTGHRWGIGLPRRSDGLDALVAQAVAAVGAEEYANQALGTMSGGELQRLMLAQAVIGTPDILLLDEPLASLDLRNQMSVAQLVAGLARARNMAVLLIAHDVNPLLPVLDRVMYIARGKVTIGRSDQVITSEHLSSLYETQVEVLRDSGGRLFVVGLEEEAAHPHALDRVGGERG